MEPKLAPEPTEEPKSTESTEALPPPPVAPEETAPQPMPDAPEQKSADEPKVHEAKMPEPPQLAPATTPEPAAEEPAAKASEEHPEAQQPLKDHGNHGKTGLIISTIMVVIILCALAVFAYMQSN